MGRKKLKGKRRATKLEMEKKRVKLEIQAAFMDSWKKLGPKKPT